MNTPSKTKNIWQCTGHTPTEWVLGTQVGNEMTNIRATVRRLDDGRWWWESQPWDHGNEGIEPSRETAMEAAWVHLQKHREPSDTPLYGKLRIEVNPPANNRFSTADLAAVLPDDRELPETREEIYRTKMLEFNAILCALAKHHGGEIRVPARLIQKNEYVDFHRDACTDEIVIRSS